MTYRTKNLNQTGTYWGNPIPDGIGWYTFDDPVTIDCRWEDKEEIFIDENGQEKVSSSVVYAGQDIDVKGYVALGDYTASAYADPKSVTLSQQVGRFDKIPNLRGDTFVGKIFGVIV